MNGFIVMMLQQCEFNGWSADEQDMWEKAQGHQRIGGVLLLETSSIEGRGIFIKGLATAAMIRLLFLWTHLVFFLP